MRAIIGCVIVGLFLGFLLYLAERYGVLPWLIGFMLACLSRNVLVITGHIK